MTMSGPPTQKRGNKSQELWVDNKKLDEPKWSNKLQFDVKSFANSR